MKDREEIEDMLKDVNVVESISLEKKDEFKLVVRLSTDCYKTDRGLVQKKTIKFLMRKSNPESVGFFEEEISYVGAEEVIRMINNLEKCEDGVYQIRMTNVLRDWESGCIEEYEYELLKCDDQCMASHLQKREPVKQQRMKKPTKSQLLIREGDTIEYTDDFGEKHGSVAVSDPWLLGGHTWVVKIQDKGAYDLTRCKKITMKPAGSNETL